MNNAILYAKSNALQRLTIKKVLDEFASIFQCQMDGGDSILDIGSGTGDVTMELVQPLLPSNFRRLVGCDISDKMIDYAQKHYNHPKVYFSKLDIADKDGNRVTEFLNKFGLFNHIVSFYCLHWVPNQQRTMENIYKLLTPNGDCLLVFISSTQAFTVYVEMSESSKWSKYMHDARVYTSPYHWMANPADNLRSLMQTAGFASSYVQIQKENYICKNFEEFENIVWSVNPFVDRIPVNEQKEFIVETALRMLAKNNNLPGELCDVENLIFIEIAVVYAKK